MRKSKLSAIWTLITVLMSLFAIMGTAGATSGEPTGVVIESIEINGFDNFNDADNVQTRFERGETLEINIRASTDQELNGARVKVWMDGHKKDVSVESKEFDVELGDKDQTYFEEQLELKLPENLDQDRYLLTVYVGNSKGHVEEGYWISVDTKDHDIVLGDIDFNTNPIEAGRGLEATVRVKNMGDKDEDSVKIGFEIAELELEAADDYIDNLESEDSKSSEPLYVRIPVCAKAGIYKAKVTVSYDDGDETASVEKEVEVLESELCGAEAKNKETKVTALATSQTLVEGEGGSIYPLTIENPDKVSKTYTISAVGAEEWATLKVYPTNVLMLGAGSTGLVQVYATPNKDAKAGDHVFIVEIKEGDKVVQQVPLTAVIAEKESNVMEQVKTALTVGLVLIVVVVAVLGVMLAINRMKAKKEGAEEPALAEETLGTEQTYY